MERETSFHENRVPPKYDSSYETFQGKPFRVDTALYRRELYLPKTINPSLHDTAIMEQGSQRNASSEEKKESKSFKKLLTNFMGYTSAHGIGRLADSKSIFFKIFWSLVCLGAFGMFIYQARGLFLQYLNKPVATSVSITFEKRLSFPVVSVCNLNMMRKDAMPAVVRQELESKLDYSPESEGDDETRERRDTTETDSNIYFTTTPNSLQDDTFKNDDEYSEYYDDLGEDYSFDFEEEEDEEYPEADELPAETRLRLEIDRVIGSFDEGELYHSGHQFENLIRNCSWKGINCKTGNWSKFWTYQWNYKYGNCFSFNIGADQDGQTVRVLKATKPGPSQGLTLEMNVEQDSYIGPLTVEAGVRVLLSRQGDMTFPYEEGFSIAPGMSTSVGIKKTKIIRLDRFNNKSCLPQNELPATNIYRKYKNVTSYSQQACLNSCLGLSQRIRCGCSEHSFPSDIPPCDVFDKETSKCLKTVKSLFNNEKLSCLAECRQACQEEVIQKTISSSQWPSEAYKSYLIKEGRNSNRSQDLLQLNVFFNELNHEIIEEKYSYGQINLLADIGGQLGLWIGISVITCCEVLELFIMFLTVCVKKINAESQVHEVPVY